MITLKIGTGVNQVAATSHSVTGYHDIYLQEDEGWDNFPARERISSDKLVGDGVFVSQYSRLKNKIINFTFVAVSDSSPLREVRDKLAYWADFPGFITIEKVTEEDGKVISEKIQKAWINSGIAYKAKGNVAYIVFSMATESPYKTVTVDGGTPALKL